MSFQPKSSHRQPRSAQRQLIHSLNQRYRAEWDRAERLRAELADIKGSKAWRLLAWLRALKRRLWQKASPPRLPLDQFEVLQIPARRLSGTVSIVIPFRDQAGLLRACLRSLHASTYGDFELILVDNGSSERDTAALLQRMKKRSRCRVVHDPGDFNFSRLCNRGAAAAEGDFLLFLNNDTEVLAPDWLEQLLAVAADRRVGIAGATLLYPDGTIQHAGIYGQSDGTWTHPYRGQPGRFAGERDELRQVRAVPAVTAACLLIGTMLFREIGGFSERYPVTGGDVELCCRVRQRGLLVAITPHARLLHFESLSRGYSII